MAEVNLERRWVSCVRYISMASWELHRAYAMAMAESYLETRSRLKSALEYIRKANRTCPRIGMVGGLSHHIGSALESLEKREWDDVLFEIGRTFYLMNTSLARWERVLFPVTHEARHRG